jgi:hypothetical protein
MKTSMLSASLVLVAAACGGGKKDPPLMVIDGPPQQMDAPAVTCTAPASVAALMNPFYDYTADNDTMTTGNQETYFWGGDLNTDTLVDWLNIGLYEGPPPGFTTANFPATPFTIQLTGAELSYSTCSACITLQTDVDLPASTEELIYADDYMATGGSITITTLTATNIAGSLSNVTFVHTDFAQDGTQTPNASGCTATVSASFDGMVMPEARANGARKPMRVRLQRP